MESQRNIESQKIDSLDLASEPTAVFLQRVFEYTFDSEFDKRIMGRLGYCAGKCVYLLDALDDLYDDLKSGGYNPIIVKYSLKNGDDTSKAEDETVCLINTCITELAATYELLSCKRYKSIMSNIIYLGMPRVLKTIREHGKKTDMEVLTNE